LIADGKGEYFPVMCDKEHTLLIAAILTASWYCLELDEWALALWEGCYGVSSNLHVRTKFLFEPPTCTSANAALNPQSAGSEQWSAWSSKIAK